MEEVCGLGVGVVVGGAYNSGLLVGGSTYNYVPAPPDILARVARLNGGRDADAVLAEIASLNGKPVSSDSARRLFPDYLSAIEHLTNEIDRWGQA